MSYKLKLQISQDLSGFVKMAEVNSAVVLSSWQSEESRDWKGASWGLEIPLLDLRDCYIGGFLENSLSGDGYPLLDVCRIAMKYLNVRSHAVIKTFDFTQSFDFSSSSTYCRWVFCLLEGKLAVVCVSMSVYVCVCV